MNRDEAIEYACATTALVYHSIKDYSRPSDGFCHNCPAGTIAEWDFKNDGHILEYVRLAAIEKLERDGYSIAPQMRDLDPRG